MKVDVGLINDFIQKLGKRSKVQEFLLVSFLRKLVKSLESENETLSIRLMEKKTARSARFLNLWMVDSQGWKLTKDLPQLNVTETTATDVLEAIVVTLLEILPMQSPSDGWTTVEALLRLFHHWTEQLSCNGNISSVLSYPHQLLVNCCVEICGKFSDEIFLRRICEDERDFVGSALSFFTLTIDHCADVVSKYSYVLNRIIETVLICLLDPDVGCHRELFWRASMLLPKVGALGTKALKEIVQRQDFIKMMGQVHVWKKLDWKSEAILAMLCDVIPILRRDGILPNLRLYREVLLACISYKSLNVAGINNAVFALGLLTEAAHEDFQEEEILGFIEVLICLHKTELVTKDRILHDNVIGAIARISCHFLDTDTLEMIVPLLHTSLPLKADIEENVPVLRFWKIWFKTPPVIPQHLPGLLDAFVRVAAHFPSHGLINSGLTELLGNLEMDFPVQYIELLTLLKLQDMSPATASSVGSSTIGNGSISESYFKYDNVDDCLKDMASNQVNSLSVYAR